MKIYIMGPVGAGKSTLAKCLSKKYQIDSYELDCLVYDDMDNHRKRTEEEIEVLFSNVLETENWIIEDVGRKKFIKGREECDIIYYLKIGKIEVYKRVVTRWIKQRRGKLKYNYSPTFGQLLDMLKYTHRYFKKEQGKLLELEKYKEKLVFLDKNQLNKWER